MTGLKTYFSIKMEDSQKTNFLTLNYSYRRRNSSQSQWFAKDFVSDIPPTLDDLQDQLRKGDSSFIEKLMYFGKTVPGTSAYWRSKKAELYSWINHHIEKKRHPYCFLNFIMCRILLARF